MQANTLFSGTICQTYRYQIGESEPQQIFKPIELYYQEKELTNGISNKTDNKRL